MSAPSIKGSIFLAAAADVVRLRDAGTITDEQIEMRLEASDLALLEANQTEGAWYPLPVYARLLDLLGETEGHGNDDYFRKRGRANARRLIDAASTELNYVGPGRDLRSRARTEKPSRDLRRAEVVSACARIKTWAADASPPRSAERGRVA